jgi:hypothetical protein
MPDINTKNAAKYMPVVSTTVALTDKANVVNTRNKYIGKLVFNSTTGILLCAAGPLTTDVWKNCGTGATAQTPV